MESINVGNLVPKREPQDDFENEMANSVKGINIHNINIGRRVGDPVLMFVIKGFQLFIKINIKYYLHLNSKYTYKI